jgi:hypothetical protein
MQRIRPILGASLLALLSAFPESTLLATPSEKEETGKKQAAPSPPPKAEPEAPLRFTNADLPPPIRMGEAPPPAAAEPGEEGEAKPGGTAKGSGKKGASPDGAAAKPPRSAEAIAADIQRLEVLKADLERRERVVRNPLLKGLAPPSEDEEKAVGGMESTARLDWIAQQKAETEKSLQEARAELAQAKTASPESTPHP